jgi:uncharacterized protein
MNTTTSNSYHPVLYLRSARLQTVLASGKMRTWGPNPMLDSARDVIIDAGNGVRLLGSHSPQSARPAKGLVILLHGWGGSIDSSYMLSAGRYLHRNGYDVFRLNFRDHGDSHHLNEGLFYATDLDEVFRGVKKAAEFANGLPVFMAGFSLGANFVLRIACRCLQDPISDLRHAVAVSPVVDPAETTVAIDGSYVLRSYFLKKWRRSLARKQQLFPQLYDFSEVLTFKSVRAVTDVLLERYSQYDRAEDYFRDYGLVDGVLKDNPAPSTIIAAQDDPVIPARDFRRLRLNGSTGLIMHRYGGHNGFLEKSPFSCWHEQYMVNLFDGIVREG